MINLNLKQQFKLSLKYPQTTLNFLIDKIIYSNKPTPFPRIINCFLTEKCNFRCPMCHIKDSRLRNLSDMPYSIFKKIIDESKDYHPSFQLTGGEPLMYPKIIEAIEYLEENNLVKGLVTNGLLLDKYADNLVKSGLDFLAISLDGADETTQYHRGLVKNSFEKISLGIKKTIKVRKNNLFPNIRIATVISRYNLHNFEKILDLAIILKVDQWSLSHYFFYPQKIKLAQEKFAQKYNMGSDIWGDYIGENQSLFPFPKIEIIKQKYRNLTNYIDSHHFPIRISLKRDLDINKYYRNTMPSNKSHCHSPLNQVFIRGNGDVEICQGYILGNIKNQSLKSLWHNEKARHFREVFSKHRLMPACFRCCALDIQFD